MSSCPCIYTFFFTFQFHEYVLLLIFWAFGCYLFLVTWNGGSVRLRVSNLVILRLIWAQKVWLHHLMCIFCWGIIRLQFLVLGEGFTHDTHFVEKLFCACSYRLSRWYVLCLQETMMIEQEFQVSFPFQSIFDLIFWFGWSDFREHDLLQLSHVWPDEAKNEEPIWTPFCLDATLT